MYLAGNCCVKSISHVLHPCMHGSKSAMSLIINLEFLTLTLCADMELLGGYGVHLRSPSLHMEMIGVVLRCI